jgi:hypothetical protein
MEATMKCVKKDGEVRRVSEEQAVRMVTTQGWAFAPKSEWKLVRPTAKKVPEPAPEQAPVTEPKKDKKKKK